MINPISTMPGDIGDFNLERVNNRNNPAHPLWDQLIGEKAAQYSNDVNVSGFVDIFP